MRTFWRKRVSRAQPGFLSIELESGRVVYVVGDDSACRRCKKPIDSRAARPGVSGPAMARS